MAHYRAIIASNQTEQPSEILRPRATRNNRKCSTRAHPTSSSPPSSHKKRHSSRPPKLQSAPSSEGKSATATKRPAQERLERERKRKRNMYVNKRPTVGPRDELTGSFVCELKWHFANSSHHQTRSSISHEPFERSQVQGFDERVIRLRANQCHPLGCSPVFAGQSPEDREPKRVANRAAELETCEVDRSEGTQLDAYAWKLDELKATSRSVSDGSSSDDIRSSGHAN